MKKEKGNKTLWCGLFNYSCELERIFAYAYTKEQARVIMCRRLAKKHEVHPSHVYALFDGSKQNYEITIEVDFREGEEGD